jgi:hypothetical protein
MTAGRPTNRLPASALYIVIVIALFIALLCASLVAAAFFFRQQAYQKFRFDRLQDNLVSAANILLAGESSGDGSVRVDLFKDGRDSVELTAKDWGVYKIGVVRAFDRGDTLTSVFSMASRVDSAGLPALYLADEDRPLSVTGKTKIDGDAFLPKSGLKKAFIDGKGFEGPDNPVSGHLRISDKTLPGLAPAVVATIEELFMQPKNLRAVDRLPDSLNRSFRDSVIWIMPARSIGVVEDVNYTGNIILYSDTTLTLDSTAKLNNILVVARAVIIRDGFRGNCQIFARDSVHIGDRCFFSYPSAVGIISGKAFTDGQNNCFYLGKGSTLQGLFFLSEKERGLVRPNIRLAAGCAIEGEVYQPGSVTLTAGVRLRGSMRTGRFMYTSSAFIYENYLVDAQLSSRALSPYYLSSRLFGSGKGKQNVLQWLER